MIRKTERKRHLRKTPSGGYTVVKKHRMTVPNIRRRRYVMSKGGGFLPLGEVKEVSDDDYLKYGKDSADPAKMLRLEIAGAEEVRKREEFDLKKRQYEEEYARRRQPRTEDDPVKMGVKKPGKYKSERGKELEMLSPAMGDVLGALSRKGESSPEELASEVSYDTSDVESILEDLYEKGEVIQPIYGKTWKSISGNVLGYPGKMPEVLD